VIEGSLVCVFVTRADSIGERCEALGELGPGLLDGGFPLCGEGGRSLIDDRFRLKRQA